MIPFKLYDYQGDLINDFNDYRFSIILKARQLGISTITAAYCVWLMLFHRDKNVLVIGAEVQTTQLDFDDEGRGTAILFGDGAAAFVSLRLQRDRDMDRAPLRDFVTLEVPLVIRA